MNIEIIKKIFNQYIETIGKTNTIFVFLFTLLVSAVVVIEPLFFSNIIGNIESFYDTGVMPIDDIILTMILRGIFIIFNIGLLFVHRYYIVDITVIKTYKNIFLKYSDKIFDMYYGVYLNKKAGSIFKNFDKGVDVHFQLLFEFFLVFLKSIFSISIIVIILFIIDWKMAIIALSMLPVMIAFGFYFNKITSPRQKKLHSRWNKTFGIIGDSMNNFLLFKTLNLKPVFYKKVSKKINENADDQVVLSKQWAISDIYTAIFIMISRILVIGFGVYFLINDKISFYTLFIVFSYLGWIYFPLGAIFNQLRKIQEHLVSAKIFYEEFDDFDLENDNVGLKKISNFNGNLVFKNVGFSYIKGKKIFKDLSFSINSGEKVAFVGNTGSGKSSIVNLILRLWDNDSGKILFDGIESKKISKSYIRQNIGIVTQDNSLFNLSIKENLLFAKKGAKLKEIKQALRDAQADFVFELENGIDTVIGERGLKLSGGEKQRLSIARLFLRNPKILILDEATSALDNKTEKLIQKALDKLMKGRTSIVIAHRLSTIQNVDRIYMVENGKIIETGKYKELMNNKSKFYSLANPEHLIIN